MTTNRNREGDIGVKNRTKDMLTAKAIEGKRYSLDKKESKVERTTRLVSLCQKGNLDAFEVLFREHIDKVYRHLSVILGPGTEVDDLVQLVFLNVFQSLKRFRGKSAFSTWLFRITINVARQEIRNQTRYRKIGNAVFDASCVTPSNVENNPEKELSRHQLVYNILDRLSWKKRQPYILYTYEGYSLAEIAELLDSTVSTIGSRLQSARQEIIAYLSRRRKNEKF